MEYLKKIRIKQLLTGIWLRTRIITFLANPIPITHVSQNKRRRESSQSFCPSRFHLRHSLTGILFCRSGKRYQSWQTETLLKQLLIFYQSQRHLRHSQKILRETWNAQLLFPSVHIILKPSTNDLPSWLNNNNQVFLSSPLNPSPRHDCLQ